MSTNEDVLSKKLPVSRSTATAQGFVLDESEPPNLLVTYEKGDFVITEKGKQKGKHPGFALPGGGVETLFKILLDDGSVYVHKTPKKGEMVEITLFTERDLTFLLKYKPLQVEDDIIDGDHSLNVLLKGYRLDEPERPIRLSLKVSCLNDGREGKIEYLILVPVRDETPLEAVIREVESETSFDTEIIRYRECRRKAENGDSADFEVDYNENGLAFNYALRSKRRKIGPSRFGEIRYQELPNKMGGPMPHQHYTFHLKIVDGSLHRKKFEGPPKISESDEIKFAGWANLKTAILTKAYNEPDARYNPEGIYLQHIDRIFDCLDFIYGDDWGKYAPENIRQIWEKSEPVEEAKPDEEVIKGVAEFPVVQDISGAKEVEEVFPEDEDGDYVYSVKDLEERYRPLVANNVQPQDDEFRKWGESPAGQK